jgi:hypothetical protein
MPKAIIVALTDLYDDIVPSARGYGSPILRNSTCCWWRINATTAADAEYLFGVNDGKVVSVYRIAAPIKTWPVLPTPAIGETRRAVPVIDVSQEEWQIALSWSFSDVYGPVRYGDVSLDSEGRIHSLAPGQPAHDNEAEAR